MGAGDSSLLRPTGALLVCTAVLGLIAPAGAALAASPAPDPGPAGGTFQPDPYVAPTPAPARTVVAPPRFPVVRMPTTPAAAAVHRARRSTAPPTRKPPALARSAAPVVGLPDGQAIRAVARSFVAIEPPRRVSTGLAVALGALVLLSALFLRRASRELTR